MSKYLAPGVYVEEVAGAAKPIEGVPTSTTGFVGAARFGPVSGPPVLITSYGEYEQNFGDTADLVIDNVLTTNHVARAVQLFFENDGRKVYMARVFQTGGLPLSQHTAKSASVATSAGDTHIVARFPGLAGNMRVRVQALRSGDLIAHDGGEPTLFDVRLGDLVEISSAIKQQQVKPAGTPDGDPGELLTTAPAELAWVSFNDANRPILTASSGPIILGENAVAQKITLTVMVEPHGDNSSWTRTDQLSGLSAHPDSNLFVGKLLSDDDNNDFSSSTQRVIFGLPELPRGMAERFEFADSLIRALINTPLVLSGGSDGGIPAVAEYVGNVSGQTASGLAALAEVDSIAVVAAPGSAALGAASERRLVRDALIAHCEQLKYRFAVLAGENADLAAIQMERSNHDSKYAALYYPWLVVPHATPTAPDNSLALSPEGALCGIYARTDINRGVHKPPANEPISGILRFTVPITKGMQDMLNPKGINCLKNVPSRGNLVWGARTMSSDPQWMYVSVRRLLIYLEHSIVRGTDWAVFEPNTEKLWSTIRRLIENFLIESWRAGALMGTKSEEAFFVRCDRTTMSPDDLDNGRLVCLVGVAPIRPAEFLIFRIGQWTADAKMC